MPANSTLRGTLASNVDHLVIPAGGAGTRLAGIAGELPKTLVCIGDKPVLQHQLELAATAGIRQVTILAGYWGDKIAAFVGDGSRFGLTVRTLIEAEPLGNAGLLLQSLDRLPKHFLFLYGDIMLAVNLQRLARRHVDRDADLTVVAHPNDHPQDSDLLETDADDQVSTIHPCPHPAGRYFANLVNAALYVVRREALRPWAAASGKQDFVKDVMAKLVAGGARVLVYRTSEYIKDIGTPVRLQRVEADWQAGTIRLEDSGDRHPAIFLDRDGTLNVENGFLRSPQDLKLLPGVGMALRSLRQAGFRLVVLTNQPVIARGEASEADLAAIHRCLEWELGKSGAYLDAIYVCPHHPDGGFPGERTELKIPCDCRKPATGLFDRACRDLHIDPAGSWMIGDQIRDIEMAKRAGLRSVLVRTGLARRDGQFQIAPDHIADDLASAAGVILRHEGFAVV
jgi:D,D-heptose 1,7-bisphosphate phosphatase